MWTFLLHAGQLAKDVQIELEAQENNYNYLFFAKRLRQILGGLSRWKVFGQIYFRNRTNRATLNKTSSMPVQPHLPADPGSQTANEFLLLMRCMRLETQCECVWSVRTGLHICKPWLDHFEFSWNESLTGSSMFQREMVSHQQGFAFPAPAATKLWLSLPLVRCKCPALRMWKNLCWTDLHNSKQHAEPAFHFSWQTLEMTFLKSAYTLRFLDVCLTANWEANLEHSASLFSALSLTSIATTTRLFNLRPDQRDCQDMSRPSGRYTTSVESILFVDLLCVHVDILHMYAFIYAQYKTHRPYYSLYLFIYLDSIWLNMSSLFYDSTCYCIHSVYASSVEYCNDQTW